jgi:hypothetical protein
MEVITSLHESLNFKLPPKQRECFYEDFVMESPTRTIELFATSLGETDVSLTVHGPFEYKDIINVSYYYVMIFGFSISLGFRCVGGF